MPSGASEKVIPYLAISPILLLMERIICAAGLRHCDTIFYKAIMPVAYADNVDIIGRSDSDVAVTLSKFTEESWSIGLAVNESKTFYQQPRILA